MQCRLALCSVEFRTRSLNVISLCLCQIRERRFPSAESNFQLRVRKAPNAEKNFQLRLKKRAGVTTRSNAENNFQLRVS